MENKFNQRTGPLYLLPKVDLSDPNSREILIRLNLYAGIYRSLRANLKLRLGVVVIDSQPEPRNNEEYTNLEIFVPGSNLMTFFLGILRKSPITKTGYRTLIAGDPIFGFLSALLIKKAKTPISQIQLQFHGDTYSLSTVRGLKSFIRFLISRISLKVANSVRVVSLFQIEELKPLARKNADFFTAPIPLNFQKIPLESREERLGVGFIGRLHYERGTTQFVAIVQDLRLRNFYHPIYVIGDGPEKAFIFRELQKNNLQRDVFFLGKLESEELCAQYAKLKVILSCAPKEGYGLTLREGALSGVHVVAHKCPGAIEAKADFDAYIHLYESIHEASDLIIGLHEREYVVHSNTENIQVQKAKEMQLISNWVSSW
jgi:glycosyltransferase involved in cell wall biosynthesis